MKLPCEMIQDLLPLYHDGVCSQVSNTLVREHLDTCQDCTRVLKNIDAEIEVPKLEADAAKPLETISVKWKKKTWVKGLCIGLAAFLVFVTCWWALTQWCIVPLEGGDYVNVERYQLSDGYIYIGLSWDYGGCNLPTEKSYTENGESYYYRLRPILADRDDGYSQNGPEESFFFTPDGQYGILANGEKVKITAIYAGTPENRLLLWKEGMELPDAPASVAEDFKELQDAFAAPNAPENNGTFHVITGVLEGPDDENSRSDAVEEPMVPTE